jgi:hypothetical protein
VTTDDLEWLGTWYRNQCDGRWEHQKGLLLEPVATSTREAWRLRIDLRGTSAAGSPPRQMALYAMRDAQHEPGYGYWMRCTLTAHLFEGEGAEVEELVGVFRRWVGTEPRQLGAVAGG